VQEHREADTRPMMPAEGDGGAVGRSGRKSRANAGARLKDILQHEAKDLKVCAGTPGALQAAKGQMCCLCWPHGWLHV
jgi:hypothetical protein